VKVDKGFSVHFCCLWASRTCFWRDWTSPTKTSEIRHLSIRRAQKMVCQRLHPHPVTWIVLSKPFFWSIFRNQTKFAPFFPDIRQGFLMHFWGLWVLINPFLARLDVSHYFFWNRTIVSDLRFRFEETSNLKKNGKIDKKRIYCRRKGEKQTKKYVQTLVRLLWRAVVAGLKPLRFPRTWACGNTGESQRLRV